MKNKPNHMKNSPTGLRLFQGFVLAATGLVLVLGFLYAGSPQEERMRRFDQQRTDRLNQISYAVESYYQTNNRLPMNISEVFGHIRASISPDPVTGLPFSYTVLTDTTYELCAEFDLATEDPASKAMYQPLTQPNFWLHDAGRTCYTPTVRPLVVPPSSKPAL